MNIPLVLFSCRIIIVVSLEHDNSVNISFQHNGSDHALPDLKEILHSTTDSTERTKDNKLDITENVKPTESSSINVFENVPKVVENDSLFLMTKYLPIINIVTKLMEDLADVIKNQIGFSQASSAEGGSPSYAFINQTFTQCRSESLSPSGGRNCITRGFTIGGLMTILVLLAVSFCIKIVQTVKELNTVANPPREITFQQSLPINEQFSGQPFNVRPIGNIHPMYGPLITPASPGVYRTSEYNIAPTIRPTASQGFREGYRNDASSFNSFYPVNRLGRSDEVLYDHEYIHHRG